MSEIRRNPLSGRFSIIATDDLGSGIRRARGTRVGGEDREVCWLCDEAKSSEEDRVTVVGATSPILVGRGEAVLRNEGLYSHIKGVGSHKVVIETKDHSLQPYDQPLQQFARSIQTCRDICLEMQADRRCQYTSVFRYYRRNRDGEPDHPHSEVVSCPVVPEELDEEIKHCREQYRSGEKCILCRLLETETDEGSRIVMRNEGFVALAPYASCHPFEIWVLPIFHSSSFVSITDDQSTDMARVLGSVLLSYSEELSDPPYYYHIYTAPARSPALPHYHWYVRIIPEQFGRGCEGEKDGGLRGFVTAPGLALNPVAPEEAARALRERIGLV